MGYGLLLSLFAGLATTVGAAIAFVVRDFTNRMLALLLGFAGGVMIAVSFLELYVGAQEEVGAVWAAIAFFTGFIAIFLIDVLIPHSYETEQGADRSANLKRAGMLTAIGIAIHNFPEGLVVLSGAAKSPELGTMLAIAIAMHNIPEGIAVPVPIAAATGKRSQAFWISFVSGLAEPLGAALGALVLMHVMTPMVTSLMLAGVAGLMVFISLDELLPTAHCYGEEHAATLGALAGMAVMVTTLIVL
ncbi:MAG TPA: zinc transporter ZupT [Armatimonadetes bacterium]|nr:zinc transporter ZupT [Armatimonadota bacterium]